MKVSHLGIVALLALAACRSGSNVAPPLTTPVASDSAKTPAPAPGAMTLPAVKVLLDDQRLQGARALERLKDYVGAAKAVREALPADLAAADACAWDFLEGRLYVAGNATADALPAFERASAPACPLAGYATLRHAQALARSGRADDAIARAKAVPADHTVLADEVKMVIAESLAAKGDRAGALPLWRAWLAANPHGSRWVDTSVRIATALLDGVDGPPESHAREAYDLATRVVVEAPKLAESAGATAARLRAVAAFKPKDPNVKEALSEIERQRQAQAYLDTGEPTKAFEIASGIGKPAKQSCKAALTRANAGTKKSPKSDVWSDAIAACEKEPELVTALYAGAKARTSKESRTAIEWYAKVEEKFPSHRLADDARFRAALLVAQSGEADRSEEMLRTLPDAYPSGDMRTEALFRAALGRMSKGDWATAKGDLDRILEIAPDDRHWATAGRAEYFRGRVAAMTGDAEGARARWRHVVEKHPLSFYMLMAHAQLRAADPALAAKVLDESIGKDKAAAGGFPSKELPILASPGVLRAVRLLEVDDLDSARAEVKASGATAEGADPEAVWAIGVLYNQAGHPELGHVFSRGRLTDHLEHWPEAKWRTEWETAYPRAFEPLVTKSCTQHTLPQSIAWGIMREESSFVADARSPAAAYGLMQLIIPTAKLVAVGTGFGSDEASLKQPEVSIALGTKLLAGLRTRHGHDALAIGAYNGGSGAVDRWMRSRQSDDLDLFVENVGYEETRNYIKRVLSSVAAYGYLYDKKSFDDVLAIPLRVPAK
ncbi:MAG: lytic transglycosylase domain-containing protein [Labilithrix sp.]|nr:lytic transglycosylase domain-containing protein [Labilithrix sp.]MCW5815060.1 lytic transglycosylase domain-containing protein [Labilithrix sp.]